MMTFPHLWFSARGGVNDYINHSRSPSPCPCSSKRSLQSLPKLFRGGGSDTVCMEGPAQQVIGCSRQQRGWGDTVIGGEDRYQWHTVYRETFEEENFCETGEIEDFAEKTLVGQWPVDGAHMHMPLKFAENIFVNGPKSTKFAKVFFLESFLVFASSHYSSFTI